MVERFYPSDIVLTYLESNHLSNPVAVKIPDSLSKRMDARIAGVCLTYDVVKRCQSICGHTYVRDISELSKIHIPWDDADEKRSTGSDKTSVLTWNYLHKIQSNDYNCHSLC
jgi:hypothetical protein